MQLESNHYSQLQQMIRNGYRANTSRQHKSGNLQHQQQPSMQQVIIQTQLHHPSGGYNAAGLPYSLQNMSLNEIHPVDGSRSKLNAAGGSESCSSNGSAGESSPPETPTILSNNISTGNVGNVRLKDPQYTKQMNFSRINGRPEKVGGGPTILYAPPVSPQQVAAAGTYEMILAQNMLQPNPVVSNNNTLNSNASTASCNNNLGSNTVIIPSHPPPSLASTQQFGASYPYPAAAVNRPPHQLLQHVTAPPGTFRLHNGENIYYPHYPVFLPAAAPQQQTIRSSPSQQQPPHSLPANATTLPLQPQPQQQPTVSVSPSPVAATLVSPYSTIVPTQSGLLKSKPQISCYNCGSQNHTGRDCHEASMEEVTRGAVYKLDYSSGMGVNMSSSNSSNNNLNSSSSNSNNNIGANTTSSTTTSSSSSSSTTCAPGSVVTTIDITSDTSSSTASSTSSSSSLLSTSNNK